MFYYRFELWVEEVPDDFEVFAVLHWRHALRRRRRGNRAEVVEAQRVPLGRLLLLLGLLLALERLLESQDAHRVLLLTRVLANWHQRP